MIKKYSGEDLRSLKGIYLVDFYADWCGPCKMLGQVLESLENTNIIKINVDHYEELSKEYKVMSIPKILIMKDGEIQTELIGFRSKEEIENELKKLFK